MSVAQKVNHMNRREFVKSFPQRLLDGFRQILTATSLPATKKAGPSFGGRDSKPYDVGARFIAPVSSGAIPPPPENVAGPPRLLAEKISAHPPRCMAENGAPTLGSYPRIDDCLDTGPRIARLDISRCLAWGGANCQLCYLACPLRDRAIEMCDQKPVVHSFACDGCAMCEAACRTVNNFPAIDMVLSKSSESKTTAQAEE